MNLDTPRLLIRPVQPQDAVAIYDYRGDVENSKFLSRTMASLDETKEFIAKCEPEFNQHGSWYQTVLVSKDNNKVIGDVGLHFTAQDVSNSTVEIGYTLNQKYWGKGFAYEALQALISKLFREQQKHRICASVDPRNVASIGLLEKLGFRKEAHFVKSLFFRGEWVDDVVYGLLNDDWQE